MKNTELLPLFDGISESIEKVADYIADRCWDDGICGEEHALEMETNLNLLRASVSMLLDLKFKCSEKDAWNMSEKKPTILEGMENMKNQELSVLYKEIERSIEDVIDFLKDVFDEDNEDIGCVDSDGLKEKLCILEKTFLLLGNFKHKCSEIEDIKEADFIQSKYIMLRAHYYAKLEEAETIRIETARIVDDYQQAMKSVVDTEKEIKRSIDEMESKIIPKRHGALKEPGVMGNDIAYGREEFTKQFQKLPGDMGLSERLT